MGGEAPNAAAAGSDAFGQFVRDLLTEPATDTYGQPLPEDPDRTLKHFGRILIDDLHVHRLRDVWLLLHNQLRDEHQGMPDSELV